MARKVLMLACALLAALTHASVDPRGAVRDLHGNARQWAAPARHIAGLHYPIDITPRVDIPDEHWLTLMFPTLLGRMGQSLEYRVAKDVMRVQQHPVHDIFYDFMNLPEFQNNPALSDPAAYVTRVYQYWLRRMPTETEIASWTLRLTPPNVQTPTVAQPYTWFGFQQSIAGSSEYATNENICPTGYYSLNAPVNPTSLLMADLFNGTARLQLLEESELLRLTIPSAQRIWDQKMPIVRNPDCWLTPSDSCPKYVAFTRTYRGNNNFYLTTLRSYDAVNFAETEEMWHSNATYYDGHISVDHSVCPPRYVMTMECSVNGSQASLCTAYTTTPSMPWSWSEPKVIVYGCRPGQPGQMSCNSSMVGSASTGVTLIDGHKKYMAWTNVVDGDPKIVKTYSAMTGPLADVSAYFGTIEAGTKPIRTMLDAQPGGFCTSSWDCNCKDKQDWKREGDYYYALFNGANYYRCGGTWGISIARDTEADAGVYTDELPLLQGIPSVVHNTCGISYPVLNVIDGELFVYYAGITKNREPVAMRSRIVPIHPSV